MKANAVSLLALFERKMRLEVPLFQRKYVWSREQQWEPLWEDIVGKFKEYLEGRKDAPVHFLGAMVLDLKLTPVTHVEKRQVIDGQQRLTTLQIFLAAFRDFCRALGCEDLAKEFDRFTLNSGMMANPEMDKYKVWPTQEDQGQFTDVVGLGSRAAILEKHPLVRQKYARKPDPRPRMVEAYLYFSDEIQDFFIGTEGDPPVAVEQLPDGMEECFQALKSALQVVVIDLEPDDDAQVIFETLNARGAPLLPADLLRNYIFLRAARLNEPQEELYNKYWLGFEEDFWGIEVRQGRLIRPRSDLFMQHFLASRKTVDIPIKHLFIEYRWWIERSDPVPFKNVAAELATLSKQRDEFRRILEPRKGDVVFGLATFLNDFDISTAYPLLLFLFDAGLSGSDWKAVSNTLESYLVRRAVLGWTTKSYNKIFLKLTKEMRQRGPTQQTLITLLSELEGESAAWPTDDVFLQAWQNGPAYAVLNNAKLVHILRRLSETYLNKHNERITIDGPLTIEHLLPRNWTEHWPLSSGELGLTAHELWDADSETPKVIATRIRDTALQTIGNLTILTQELNSSVSNCAWAKKKQALLKASLLPINQELHEYDKWDEKAIQKRGKKLFQRASKVWPGPA
jgi:uncharacterized protein with ParB-like and HNH nuclease domain